MIHKPYFKIVLFILLELLQQYSYAQIILEKNTTNLFLSGMHADIFEDSSNSLSLYEVVKKDFTKLNIPIVKNTNPKSTYWLRFKIKNQGDIKTKWVLEGITPNLYSLEIWIPDYANQMTSYISGLKNNASKVYPHKNYIFDLPSSLKEYDIYIKVRTPNLIGLEFNISTQQYFTWYALNEYYFLGCYYGILLLMLVYSILLFITNKEKVYIYYAAYLASCMFLSLSEDGLGIELFWSDFATANLFFSHNLAPSLFLLSFVFYTQSFLNLKTHFPLANKIAIASALLFPIINSLHFIINTESQNLLFLEDYYLVPFTIVFATSVYVYFKGYKSARFFILGYLVVFISMIILQLRLHWVFEGNIFTVYIFNFGIIAETLILSFALADRLRNIRVEKQHTDLILVNQLQENTRLQNQLVEELQLRNQINEKVNIELEGKVIQRTQDLIVKSNMLTEANEKLDLYSKKLTEMNLRLDIDNWQLKKDVHKERTARIVHEELDYKDFIKSFPDKNACLRYLENLKWPDTYTCRKCGNEKFTPKLFSRKCTSCDYIESPTSNTLFHGIKIPLQKAFFLVYLTNSKAKKFTLEELAQLLEIGKNTCWEFRKKIKARHDEKRKTLRTNEVESWDLLILD